MWACDEHSSASFLLKLDATNLWWKNSLRIFWNQAQNGIVISSELVVRSKLSQRCYMRLSWKWLLKLFRSLFSRLIGCLEEKSRPRKKSRTCTSRRFLYDASKTRSESRSTTCSCKGSRWACGSAIEKNDDCRVSRIQILGSDLLTKPFILPGSVNCSQIGLKDKTLTCSTYLPHLLRGLRVMFDFLRIKTFTKSTNVNLHLTRPSELSGVPSQMFRRKAMRRQTQRVLTNLVNACAQSRYLGGPSPSATLLGCSSNYSLRYSNLTLRKYAMTLLVFASAIIHATFFICCKEHGCASITERN